MQRLILAPPSILEPVPVAEMRGHWLSLARGAWVVVALAMGALLLASIPAYIRLTGVYTEQEQAAGRLLGSVVLYSPSPEFEFWMDVAYNLLSFAASILCFALAALIFFRKSNERMALLVSLTLLIFGVVMTGPLEMLGEQRLGPEYLALFGQMLLWAFLLFMLYLFPDGHFVPGWTRWAAVLLIPWALALALWQPANTDPQSFLPFMVLYTLPSLTAPIAQLYRYRRVSSPVQREQTRWVIFGFSTWIVAGTAFTAIIAYLAAQFVSPTNPEPTFWSSLFVFTGRLVWPLALFLVPVSLTVAVLRYRLFDIDLIIRRGLVYGTLTIFVILLYVLTVGLLSAVLNLAAGATNLAVSLIATGLIAVMFQPLRERLQRAVNRLIYGDRDDPYGVLARLGQRLESVLAPDAVLPTIVETIAQTLKLPYVAIRLSGAESRALETEYKRDSSLRPEPADLVTFPLTYYQETVGELVVVPRAPGEVFSAADCHLLESLADQAGMAAHALRLTTDLQLSRERLVTAREEERRRIRRDLHDGLGPALASMTLKLDAARNLLNRDPVQTEHLLAELKAQTQSAISDIRRLVYDLRPPALDELGLVPALLEQANRYGYVIDPTGDKTEQGNGDPRSAGSSGTPLKIVIDAPDKLPPLPAAVEVAAYRIVTEALTNVVRHAHATECRVTIECNGELRLSIRDDGTGLPGERQGGVGLASMRERAEELGGACHVEAIAGGGTRVVARLPLA